MRFARAIFVAGALLLAGRDANACGPSFASLAPEDREILLLSVPDILFAEHLRLIAREPTDSLRAVEGWAKPEVRRAKAEIEGLPTESADAVAAMREAPSGTAAYELGAVLPPAIRLYTAGAVAFSANDLDGAVRYFESVLRLSADARRSREVWSAFMLGRIAARRGDAAAAANHFDQTRDLARGGSPDPLGLAVESLGAEAQVYLKEGRSDDAIQLYLEQSSRGSAGAVDSLVSVAQDLLSDEALFTDAIRSRATRQVLVLYLRTRDKSNDVWGLEEPEYELEPDIADFDEEEAGIEESDPQADSRPSLPSPATTFVTTSMADRLADLIEDGEPAAAYFAEAAYHHGRFDLADRVLKRAQGTSASWLRAKLALRNGDRSSAGAAYAEALAGSGTPPVAAAELSRLQLEIGSLKLSQGDFAEALRLSYEPLRRESVLPSSLLEDSEFEEWGGIAQNEYWKQTAYLAERILTEDELREFVNESVAAPSKEEPTQSLESRSELPALRLRAILARRLMRDGRVQEAIEYFDDEDLRTAAGDYLDALSRATSRWRGAAGRSEAWFEAAAIARYDGMELFGYELAPDFAVIGGSSEATQEPPDGDWVSDNEKLRYAASKPVVDARYQYRVTAAKLAEQAAELVPHRSQAYAAVLCTATSWVLNHHPDVSHEIYARYLREGAYLPWAKKFGKRCPQPDFARAGRQIWSEWLRPVTRVFERIAAAWRRVARAFGIAASA